MIEELYSPCSQYRKTHSGTISSINTTSTKDAGTVVPTPDNMGSLDEKSEGALGIEGGLCQL